MRIITVFTLQDGEEEWQSGSDRGDLMTGSVQRAQTGVLIKHQLLWLWRRFILGPFYPIPPQLDSLQVIGTVSQGFYNIPPDLLFVQPYCLHPRTDHHHLLHTVV